MDIRPPLRAHAEWLAQLREYVYGAGVPDLHSLVRDDQCELSRWIYGDAARFRHLPEYEAARQAHAAFHVEAGEVIRLMQAGRKHEAALAIERGGRLQNLSATMIRAFLWLSHRLSKAVAAEAAAERRGTGASAPAVREADTAEAEQAWRRHKRDQG